MILLLFILEAKMQVYTPKKSPRPFRISFTDTDGSINKVITKLFLKVSVLECIAMLLIHIWKKT